MAEKLADVVVNLVAQSDELKQGLSNAEKNVRGWSGRVQNIASTALLGAGAAAAAGMVAIGKEAFNAARDVQESASGMAGALGLSADEAERYRETMRDIYTDNFGDSYQDVADALQEVSLQFERIGGPQSQQQLKTVTEWGFAMRDAFGEGVNESVGAAITLMDEFGLSAQEAQDFITAGFQRGLNSSDDFLDSIGEYSNQFSSMGANAGEFFSVLETGMAGGVLGTDKVADAFKEARVRILEDTDETRTALAEIGIDYDELAQGFANGSITQIEAIQDVIEKIREIEDPILQNQVGVALFGTQWEDTTGDIITDINSQKTSLGELEGATASLAEQYNTTTSKWESATRAWHNALVPVGEALGNILEQLLPHLTEFIDNKLVPALNALADAIERKGISGGVAEIITKPTQNYDPNETGWKSYINPKVVDKVQSWIGAGGEQSNWSGGGGFGGMTNNIEVTVNGTGAGYNEGIQAGRGIADELRMMGY